MCEHFKKHMLTIGGCNHKAKSAFTQQLFIFEIRPVWCAKNGQLFNTDIWQLLILIFERCPLRRLQGCKALLTHWQRIKKATDSWWCDV